MANLTDGGTLLLLDGIYSTASGYILGKVGATLQTTVKAQTGTRPILTTASGTPPSIILRARTTLDGVWLGGGRTATDTALTHGNDCIIQNCTFFNYYEVINEGASTRDQYLSNRFVNCGTGLLYHDIYISNMSAAAGQGAVIRNNIHVGGEGYKIHLWHDPKYTTIQNNFSAGRYDIVVQGDGHTVDHNIVWCCWLWPNAPTNSTVSKNVVGPVAQYGTQGGMGAGSTSDGNISVAPAATWGTNPTQWTQGQWQANAGYSVAQIDDTVNNLTDAFLQSTANIWIDNGIEPLFTILAVVRDAVAGPVPWPDSPPQAPQAAIDMPFHHGRGGIPLSRKHKGGRNRQRITRSRRLTKR